MDSTELLSAIPRPHSPHLTHWTEIMKSSFLHPQHWDLPVFDKRMAARFYNCIVIYIASGWREKRFCQPAARACAWVTSVVYTRDRPYYSSDELPRSSRHSAGCFPSQQSARREAARMRLLLYSSFTERKPFSIESNVFFVRTDYHSINYVQHITLYIITMNIHLH